MTEPSSDTDSPTLFEDRIVFGQPYTITSAKRFCARCDIATTALRCEWCGRFTTSEMPAGWYGATLQTNFTTLLADAIGKPTRSSVRPAEGDAR